MLGDYMGSLQIKSGNLCSVNDCKFSFPWRSVDYCIFCLFVKSKQYKERYFECYSLQINTCFPVFWSTQICIQKPTSNSIAEIGKTQRTGLTIGTTVIQIWPK